MTLSKYLVLQSKDLDLDQMTLNQVKDIHRGMTRTWMTENQDFEDSMKSYYQEVTGETYASNKEEIYNGYSDHYSEKLFIYSSDTKEIAKQFQNVIYTDADIAKIKKGIEEKSILGFIGHLGGMEFIPTFFAQIGIPVTVMLRFKSDLAKKMAAEKNDIYTKEGWDVNMIDVGGELYRNFRKFLSEKRLLITVFDGFDNWQLNHKSEKQDFAGKEILLDSTPKRLHSLTGKGSVFYISMIRRGDEYHLNVEEVEAPDSNGLPTNVFNKWSKSVLDNPNQWYIWDEVDELLEQEA
jgi:hypothetical protein